MKETMISKPSINYELIKDNLINPTDMSGGDLVELVSICKGNMLTAVVVRDKGYRGVAVDTDELALWYQYSHHNFAVALDEIRNRLKS